MNTINETPINYIAGWLRPEAADKAFKTLWDELDWVRHPNVPRREYYVHADEKPYSYGIAEYARTYESQSLHPELGALWSRTEAHYKMPFETCFLNGYDDGKDHLGWHSDDSPEMDDSRPIIIVTLGAEREIWFRRRPSTLQNTPFGYGQLPVEKLRLGHGSACEMRAGMQDTHQHRIPKGDREYGPRISLTFRGYVQP